MTEASRQPADSNQGRTWDQLSDDERSAITQLAQARRGLREEGGRTVISGRAFETPTDDLLAERPTTVDLMGADPEAYSRAASLEVGRRALRSDLGDGPGEALQTGNRPPVQPES